MTKEAEDDKVEDQTKMFVASLLTISCVFLFIKIVLILFRQKNQPLGKSYDDMDFGTSTDERTNSTTYGSIF